MIKVRSLLLVSTALALASCSGGADDVASPGEGNLIVIQPPAAPPPPPPPPPPPAPTPTPTPTGPAASCPAGTANVGTVANRRNCQLSGTITGNLVLRNLRGTIYSLSGVVRVGNDIGGDGTTPGGAQGILTIEPGVVLFGSSGADALVINRGSQIFAEGTMTQPIILTSRANVEGQSTNDSIGQFGGLVILGRAPLSRCIGAGVTPGSAGCQAAVEGVSNSFFGGALPADSSGRLRFFRISFSGFEVSPGNELNGITLGGVGNGTTLDRVQVANSSDDGIEWFGGTVNGRYLVLTGNDDDSLDTDQGYRGDNQFVIVTQRSGGGDRIIEADSPGNENVVPRSRPRFANFTFISSRTPAAVLLRGGTDFVLVNGIITGSPTCIDVDGGATIQAAQAGDDGPPRFESVFLSCTNPFENDTDVNAAAVAAAFNAGTNNVSNGTSTLQNTIINGPNEAARPAFNAATLGGGFFQTTTYIGAVRDASDTWYAGWTCNLPGQPACSAVPADSGTATL